MTMHDVVRAEIEALHEFFVAWFSAAVPREKAVFDEGYTARFASDCVLIPPAGMRLGAAELGQAIEQGYGSNDAFRVRIRQVEIRLETTDVVVATYEEWQRNARASTPHDNGRVATVIFHREEGDALRWQHVHETWLPAEVMAAGPYNF